MDEWKMKLTMFVLKNVIMFPIFDSILQHKAKTKNQNGRKNIKHRMLGGWS